MKAKKLILAITIIMYCMNGMAQDSYRQAVKKYYMSTNLRLGDATKDAFTEANKQKMITFDETESENLIQKYIEERYIDIFIDEKVLTAFQNNITEAELKELDAFYQTPEGKRAKEMTERGISEEDRQDFNMKMLHNLMKIATGETPEYTKADKGISKTYIKLFKQFYEESGASKLQRQLINKIVGFASKNGVPSMLLDDFIESSIKDVRNVALNSFNKNWTEDDLRTGIKYVSMPAYKHAMNAVSDMISMLTKEYAESTEKRLRTDYTEWLEKEIKLTPEQAYQKAMELAIEGEQQESYRLLQESANEGYVQSQLRLGIMYDNGTYVAKDSQKAFQWYMKAAEQGNPSAENLVGSMYVMGNGVEKDPEQGFIWLKKAAEHDDAISIYMLGLLYENGDGTKKDYKKAMECYSKAVEKGQFDGMYYIGLMYLNGHGVPKNNAKAFEWILKAGEKEVKQAYTLLEYMYAAGIGTRKDPVKAAYWKIKDEETKKK